MIIVKRNPDLKLHSYYNLQDLHRNVDVSEIAKWIGKNFDGEVEFWDIGVEQLQIVQDLMHYCYKNHIWPHIGGNNGLPYDVNKMIYGDGFLTCAPKKEKGGTTE